MSGAAGLHTLPLLNRVAGTVILGTEAAKQGARLTQPSSKRGTKVCNAVLMVVALALPV